MKILLAEDNPQTREEIRELLRALGHEVIAETWNGEQLVELCCADPPDLIISDIHLPIMEGPQAVAEIWRSFDIPVVFCSGFPIEYTARNFPGIQALQKPVNIGALQAAIEQAITKAA